MKVMVIVKATRDSEAGALPNPDMLTAMGKFNEELAEAGVILMGDGLRPSSHGARVHFSGKDRFVTDGPFTETKELIAGFWIWQVASLDEAIAWGKRCPNPHEEECHIEIRPFYEMEDFAAIATPEHVARRERLNAQLGNG